MDRKTVLTTALRLAGKTLLTYEPAQLNTAVKSTAGDFVTTADFASESVIVETIKKSYPNARIISEETSDGQELLNETDLLSLTAWVIDPLDGTNNFKRGMAYSGISIGYIENGEILLGGIFDPYRELLYFGEKDREATCNNQNIHIASKQSFDAGTRVCTSNSYEYGTMENLKRFEKLGYVWVDVLGSAVLIMADIASGRLDLYHHNGLKPWDNAAGFLIAQQAGAKIVGIDGQPVTWLTSNVVMGNPSLVDEFLNRLVTS